MQGSKPKQLDPVGDDSTTSGTAADELLPMIGAPAYLNILDTAMDFCIPGCEMEMTLQQNLKGVFVGLNTNIPHNTRTVMESL